MVRKHVQKKITGLNGCYIFGSLPLMMLFAGEQDPTLLKNTGLILAAIGIWIDVATSRAMKRQRLEYTETLPAKTAQKKLYETERKTLIVLRIATLSIAALCAAAFVFGLDFMCWLRGPDWISGCNP